MDKKFSNLILLKIVVYVTTDFLFSTAIETLNIKENCLRAGLKLNFYIYIVIYNFDFITPL